jgi:hypothetical protein
LVHEKRAVGVAVCSRYLPTDIAIRRNPALRSAPALLVVRDICRNTDERTVIATLVPAAITDYTVRVFAFSEPQPELMLLLEATLNSFVFDFLARLRVGGTHLSNYILDELPVPRPENLAPAVRAFVLPRVLELTYTADSLSRLAGALGWADAPFPWDPKRRFLIRCELDAALFHLYGIPRDDVDYIMDTFPIVRRNDERQHGAYRTKRVILEIHDELQRAIDTGKPFFSRLDPPPGDPRAARGPS